MHLRRSAALSVLASLAFALPAAAAGPSPSPAQATFGIAPGTAGKPDDRGLIHVVTSPGVVLHDEVVLQNASTFPVTLAVYASDAVSTKQGQFALGPADAKPVDAGGWIHIDAGQRTITLPARGPAGPSTAVVPLTIAVPADASPGDHAAGVVASLASKVVAGKNQHITLLQRVGARVYIRVGGAIRPHLRVDGLSATYVDNWNPVGAGKARVRFVLRNDGNIKLGARVRVTVTGLWGPTRVVELPPVALLLPGARIPESVVVDGVFPSFFQHAHVRVDALAVAGDADPRVRSLTRTVAFLAVPWSLLGCVLALLLLWRLWRRWVLRRRRRLELLLLAPPVVQEPAAEVSADPPVPVAPEGLVPSAAGPTDPPTAVTPTPEEPLQ